MRADISVAGRSSVVKGAYIEHEPPKKVAQRLLVRGSLAWIKAGRL